MPRATFRFLLSALALFVVSDTARGEGPFQENFSDESSARWRVKEGTWRVRDGKAVASAGFSMLIGNVNPVRDAEITADVRYAHDGPHAAAGIAFRLGEDSTGYAVGLREVEKGVHPEYGPWERPVLQLFRIDRDADDYLAPQSSLIVGSVFDPAAAGRRVGVAEP